MIHHKIATFGDCTALRAIYIPAATTSINNYAFNGCSSSLTIYGVSGSAAQTFANNNGIAFSTGTMPTY
ncbi:MAG: hypothetical protein IJD94_10255 [Clostridia bacterium]|nr:hypothetical protein [Clostridia bacterium]